MYIYIYIILYILYYIYYIIYILYYIYIIYYNYIYISILLLGNTYFGCFPFTMWGCVFPVLCSMG